ncbi:uncharacterized protein [Aegilops tauschii subsp. strangulata]|uniref:uncharacterized protein isoform X2 n=1 Tax=Aegilops tauschii subsp. strangulata TaxID=200361 RepID=UPI003CC8543F
MSAVAPPPHTPVVAPPLSLMQPPSMDEDDHHSDDGAPHMVELDGRALAMAAFVCSGVVQPSLANDEVVYLRLDELLARVNRFTMQRLRQEITKNNVCMCANYHG